MFLAEQLILIFNSSFQEGMFSDNLKLVSSIQYRKMNQNQSSQIIDLYRYYFILVRYSRN